MNLSVPFIRRPVATMLLTIGLFATGLVAFPLLPVSPLPQVDYPVISVRASMPGASPQVMANTVASPLERHLGEIADVNEMTSSSSVGSTRVTLQFGLDRDIDGAARDVQAAINAARADLPASLRSNPTYRKVNPADAPILVLALTSDTLTRGQIYDTASTVLAQKLSQVEGIGEVDVAGSSLPAVRVELTPQTLYHYGIGLEDVRAALSSANAHAPKGAIDVGPERYQIYANDQSLRAEDYRPLIVAYRNGAPVRLTDVGEVVDSVENIRNSGLANGKPAVLIVMTRSPNANIIDTVDRVKDLIPTLKASISPAIDLSVAVDRSNTIRASLKEVELTLMIALGLVILVVFAFLRDVRATLIPVVAVPVSLVGTLGVMYLLGFSLDNLSLMALTVATGFVVDDAVVVLENVARHRSAGLSPVQAAIKGTQEVGFTVLSMSVSLIAVFIPILLMGGIIGRLFREFAVTLSAAILISLVVSLTTTAMMCSVLLRKEERGPHGRLYRASEAAFEAMFNFYRSTLSWTLGHPRLIMLLLLATLCLNGYLYVIIPKGFFPQQDTGLLVGSVQADQSISFQSMSDKVNRFAEIVKNDPAVASAVAFTGGGQTNSGAMYVALKPQAERNVSADAVIARLRTQLAVVPGATLFLQSVQDIRAGGRQSNAQFQYTLQGDDADEIRDWAQKLTIALQTEPKLTDVNSDQQNKGLDIDLTIDRDTAARLGITVSQIDSTLYDAFGQRQVSTIYVARNQYHVIMEVAPEYWQHPDTLKQVYISKSGGSVSGSQKTNAVAGTFVSGQKSAASAQVSDAAVNQANNSIGAVGKTASSTGAAVSTARETMVPLSAVASYAPGNTPLSVNHQGLFVATTISFNLAPGVALGEAIAAINAAQDRIGMPVTIHGGFQGTANVFQQSLANEPMLILAALLAVYVVLGMLYESYVHPLTILSTLPSAGVGALLALGAFGIEFSIMAMIGVILLIGIVKKNAIMMIDFALDAERKQGMSARDAISQACLLRFRPIMMTTMAALLGAVPLAIGLGEGSELRQPLGVAIVGGLILSQMLTLYTTPVIYIYLDRFRLWALGSRRKRGAAPIPS
ncbi:MULTISPECIES: efflux RND transporter permease subunit [Phyllobacteriaceae]|jgi:multidrug efflux pump|uniref:Nodulation protein n=1 Tax=Mesorhizobium hungaricum TaxID=1566387 RepID=A0A1C2DSR7_9HYPH|nr:MULTISPECIES: efflux RND transporter permease subunit [Mesorhizobium]MBN9236301.1 efflux RND transporter permease subunit [Mesorhizobium sp.]MDQ0327799.1 multidrug efflux pump [Mesorhizobium sp. YL-MeA3-2017]OCX17807.1 nodulation protein [Mesorhizobium hungaricum]